MLLLKLVSGLSHSEPIYQNSNLKSIYHSLYESLDKIRFENVHGFVLNISHVSWITTYKFLMDVDSVTSWHRVTLKNQYKYRICAYFKKAIIN